MTGTMIDPATGQAHPYTTRQEWGARPPTRRYTFTAAPNGVFQHHTAGPTTQTVQQIQAFHMDSRGWSDIAYSFLVNQAGHIFEGRGMGVVGAHTENYNSTSHAVCWIGNSDDTAPTPAALASILCVRHNIEARFGAHGFRRHGDVNGTACPGRHLSAWVNSGASYPSGTGAPPPVPQPSEEDDDMAPRPSYTDHKGGRWWVAPDGVLRYIFGPGALAVLEAKQQIEPPTACDRGTFAEVLRAHNGNEAADAWNQANPS